MKQTCYILAVIALALLVFFGIVSCCAELISWIWAVITPWHMSFGASFFLTLLIIVLGVNFINYTSPDWVESIVAWIDSKLDKSLDVEERMEDLSKEEAPIDPIEDTKEDTPTNTEDTPQEVVEEETPQEEEVVKPKKPRRRKKVLEDTEETTN